MTNKLTAKEKKLVDSILDALIEIELEIEPPIPAKVDEELRAMGYDPKKMNARAKKFVQIALATSSDALHIPSISTGLKGEG